MNNWIRVGAVVMGAALGLPASAGAGYSSELVPISAPAAGGNTVVSDVAVAPSGDALVAWSEGDSINVISKVRRIRPDGSLGPELTLSDGTQRASSPTIAMAADGRALIAWVEGISVGSPNSVRARWLAPDDTLGPQITVRNGGMASNSSEITASALTTGAALVAFHNFSSTPGPFRRVEARRVNPDGSVGALIFPASGAGSLSVQTAPTASGGALLSWREGGGQNAQPVAANDVPGPLQTPVASSSAQAVMAGDANDHFQLVYRKAGTPSSIQYQALGADGVGTGEQTIDPDSSSANYRIATNSANRSLVLWANGLSSTQQEINARFIAADGTLEQATETLTVDSTSPSNLGVGVGGSGAAAIAWTETNADGISSLRGRALAPSSEPVTLSPPAGSASSLRLTVGPTDVGVAAWRDAIDPTDPASQARILVRQVLPAPMCPDASGTVVQGRPTRIDLSCTGLQLEAPKIVDPPAHGTLTEPDGATQSVVYTPTPGFDGTDSFTFTGANRGGVGATQTASLLVGRDTEKPKIERFKITTKRVEFAGRPAAAKRRKPSFKLRYSEAATATIAIKRLTGKRKRIGKLKAKPAALSAKVALKRRIGKRRLEPGAYRATAVAKDLAGNRSKAKRLRFTVVGPD